MRGGMSGTIKKVRPAAIFFLIITVMGIISKSIYFYALPLAETTDIVYGSPIHYEYTVTGTAQEIKSYKENINMPFTGKLINLYVAVGQEVKTGDLLFNIDASNLADEIYQVEMLIEERKQRMAQTNDGILKDQLSAQIELLKSQLTEKKESLTKDIVFSPVDGIVSKVNRKNGDNTDAASTVIEITVHTATIKTSLSFSNNYRSFEAGETIILKNSRNQDCAGIIRGITFTSSIRQLEIELDPSSLYKGEPLHFSDSFATEKIDYAIKTDAIRIDKNGYYILQLVKERTSLGEKLYAKRVDIYIGITVGEYTEIRKGIDFTYPIITNPEIKDGMEIRIY
jgi:multidrug efflux pump subunit AcrA (membrane-fusion protein)